MRSTLIGGVYASSIANADKARVQWIGVYENGGSELSHLRGVRHPVRDLVGGGAFIARTSQDENQWKED